MRIGMLTGGGDCPGLNAVIRAAVASTDYGDEFVGFMEGWRRAIEDKTMPLNLETTSGLPAPRRHDPRSSRTNVKKVEGGFVDCFAEHQEAQPGRTHRPRGWDDTQSISVELIARGVPCVGVPKTIDNDLSALLRL